MDFTFPFHIVLSKVSTITEVNGYRRDVQPASGRGSISVFITIPRLDLWSIYPHIQLVLVSPSPRVKQPGHSSIHFTLIWFSSQESMDFFTSICTPPVCLYDVLVGHIGNLIFSSFLSFFLFSFFFVFTSSHCNFTQFWRLVLPPVLDEFVSCHFLRNMTVPHASFVLTFLHTCRIFLSGTQTQEKFINICNCTIYLQMAIKFTNEPPQGIRASMKRTYQNITQVCLFLSVLIPLGKGIFCKWFMKAVNK